MDHIEEVQDEGWCPNSRRPGQDCDPTRLDDRVISFLMGLSAGSPPPGTAVSASAGGEEGRSAAATSAAPAQP